MNSTDPATEGKVNPVVFVVAWGWLVVPFTYGLVNLILKIPALFG
jgi:hypothetical protein